jgi:hypothetical protein
VIGGLGLVAAGLLAWLVVAHLRERRWFDRPDFARHRLFDPATRALGALLLAAGFVALARRAPRLAGLVAVILLAGALAIGIARGSWTRRRAFRRDLETVRRGSPDLPRHDLLVRAILRRHPQWGEELAGRMAFDYPDADDLARVVARMERGFRGFR